MLRAFVERLLAPQPSERPTAAAALGAPPLRPHAARRAPIALRETRGADSAAAAALLARIDALNAAGDSDKTRRVARSTKRVHAPAALDATPVVRSRASFGTPLPALAARFSLDGAAELPGIGIANSIVDDIARTLPASAMAPANNGGIYDNNDDDGDGGDDDDDDDDDDVDDANDEADDDLGVGSDPVVRSLLSAFE